MRKHIYIAVFAWLLFACDGVRFQQQELYSRFETVDKENKPEAVIFSDGLGTLWHSLFYCGDFKVTKEQAYQGNSSIKISWDKSKGCEWIGFGNSFSNWTAVDMSEQRFHKALTFYVRAQDKVMGALPIVAALEDFSGGGSYHFIDTKKYLHGLQIDSVWRKVIVPLWDFPVREEEVDIHSIKQMKFQLEGGGSFYLDEIKIVDYTKEEFAKFRAEVEAMKPKGNPNQLVYNPVTFDFDAWSTGKTFCQELKQEKNESGVQNIVWTYEAKDCNWSKWGINWNGWYQINFRGITERATLEFKYTNSGNAPFKIFLEDFNGKKQEIFSDKGKSTGQQEVVGIPLKDLNLEKNGFQLDQIKQLLFEGQGKGKVQIEYIKIRQI